MAVMENNNLPHGILRIKRHLSSLKPAEKRVADYIIKNSGQVIHQSIIKLAENVGVSEATVVKFCQRIGYSGYQELKIMLAQESDHNEGEHIYGEIKAEDDLNTIINKIFQMYNQSLKETKKMLEKSNLAQCIAMILAAERIFLFGYYASGVVAQDLALKFKRIGYNAEALLENHNQKTVGALLSAQDLVIAISNSGRTQEMVDSLEIVQNSGAKIIVITANLGSPVAEYADQLLLNASNETPFRGSALTSRMSQLAVIDMLFLGVATTEFDKAISAIKKTREAIKKSRV